ncbi:putative molybdenum carrier protein [Magnetococcus sp. PR-3]|uniref:putative molybdenum carrier protein n=1 Tax=Magnetococcus sp. PR-3 TaxID=3120355 RepID=UPI002FCDE489
MVADLQNPADVPHHWQKVVTGGQTGVDQAAWQAAWQAGLEIGGWVPLGRRCEAGVIPAHFGGQQTPTADYAQRTDWNVRDSDATLILCQGQATGGTLYTQQRADHYGKPWILIDPFANTAAAQVQVCLQQWSGRVLNVAGPRASEDPNIAQAVLHLFQQLWDSKPG